MSSYKDTQPLLSIDPADDSDAEEEEDSKTDSVTNYTNQVLAGDDEELEIAKLFGETRSPPSDSVQEILLRPNIKEYTTGIQNMYNLGYSVPDKTVGGGDKGVTFMIDLSTRKQKQLTIKQLIQFGKRLKPKIARYVSQKDTKRQNEPFYETPMRSSNKNGNRDDESSEFEPDIPMLEYRYWIDMMNPTSDQIDDIQQAFGIHPLTTEDIMTKSTREKIEEYTTYTYMVVNERQNVPNSNRFRNVNVNLLLFPGLVFSIHMLPINSLALVMYHVQYQLPQIVPVDWIVYKFLDMIVDEFVLMVDAIYREVDYIDTMLSDLGEGNKEEILRRIGVTRQRLTQLRGSLLSKQEILNVTCSTVRTSLFIEQKTKIYLRDVMDHVVLMIQRLDMANEMVNNTSGTYLAMISIEIAATDHKMNEAMKCFGAVATIMLPLTVITGLWGMNVQVPGQFGLAPDGELWFLIIILSFVLWMIVAAIVFRYKRWL